MSKKWRVAAGAVAPLAIGLGIGVAMATRPHTRTRNKAATAFLAASTTAFVATAVVQLAAMAAGARPSLVAFALAAATAVVTETLVRREGLDVPRAPPAPAIIGGPRMSAAQWRRYQFACTITEGRDNEVVIGSGVVVSPWHVLTAAHVAQRPNLGRVWVYPGVRVPIAGVAIPRNYAFDGTIDPRHGLAILELQQPVKVTPIDLATTVSRRGVRVAGSGMTRLSGSTLSPRDPPALTSGTLVPQPNSSVQVLFTGRTADQVRSVCFADAGGAIFIDAPRPLLVGVTAAVDCVPQWNAATKQYEAVSNSVSIPPKREWILKLIGR